jgi:tetratricopeptide (TPR) repeat protein
VRQTVGDDADLILQQGIVLARQRKLPEAITVFREVIVLDPSHAQAHHNLGIALVESRQFDAAVDSLKRASECWPDYAEAHLNLGNLLNELGRYPEAEAILRRALALRSDNAETLNGLGLALVNLDRAHEAVVMLRQAIRLRPDLVECYNNLGLALSDVGEHDRAEEAYEQALRRDPQSIHSLCNLATNYKDSNRHERALACYDLILAADPKNVITRWNRSLCLLQMGNWQRGWREYEWRLAKNEKSVLRFPEPYWDGSPLDGRTILLHAEQGRGDAIQFIRFSPMLQTLGARVVFFSPVDLAGLLRHCDGIDQFVTDGEPLPKFDVHCSLMSLPALLGITRTTLPKKVPYLPVDRDRVDALRPQFAAMKGLKVGLVWQGNPKHRNDRHRSIPLRRWAPLTKIPGATVVGLQRGPGVEQIEDCGLGEAIVRIEGPESFAETAAVASLLDMVVSVDTSVAHLAGALGIETWVPIAAHCDWRWELDRTDSDWYPTMRLFRQERLDDWKPVLADIFAGIREKASAARP